MSMKALWSAVPSLNAFDSAHGRTAMPGIAVHFYACSIIINYVYNMYILIFCFRRVC